MPQAIADSDHLREFAANLKRYNELVTDATATLEAQFVQLGETWRDQTQVKFAEEFEQTVRIIRQFQEVSEEHIPYLLKKAEKIDDFLSE
jgi:uncharacterized protein YukE